MQWVRATDDTFCIAVLGDFLGEADATTGGESVTWIPRRATPDSVMKLVGLRPKFTPPASQGGAVETVELASLQGFDPGELFLKFGAFGDLREAREAAKSGRPAAQPTSGPGREPPGQQVPGSPGLLDAILEVSQPAGDGPTPGTPEEIEAFAREVVRPHLVRDDTDAKERVAAVDRAASLRVSALLHTKGFQGLEAIWRSVVFLLSRADSIGKVRVYLVHLPREELERDLLAASDLSRSKLQALLSSPQLGAPGRRWAVVAGAYRFGTGEGEVDLLRRIARVAQGADVPWISSVGPVPGSAAEAPQGGPGPWLSDPSEGWKALRASPEAAWLGLTHPRFLLREPFGEGPHRVKPFAFREQVDTRDQFLWGHGSFLAAALLARGFSESGWGAQPGSHLEMGGMPLGDLPGPGEGRASLESPVDPAAARSLIESGLIPLLGFPERAGVRLGGIHSVAGSGSPLAAWWRG